MLPCFDPGGPLRRGRIRPHPNRKSAAVRSATSTPRECDMPTFAEIQDPMSCTSPLRIKGGRGRPLFATSLAKDLRHDYQHPSPTRCLP